MRSLVVFTVFCVVHMVASGAVEGRGKPARPPESTAGRSTASPGAAAGGEAAPGRFRGDGPVTRDELEQVLGGLRERVATVRGQGRAVTGVDVANVETTATRAIDEGAALEGRLSQLAVTLQQLRRDIQELRHDRRCRHHRHHHH